jgi:predicted SnoaL-like aldol condensation-catalyzing enzyme
MPNMPGRLICVCFRLDDEGKVAEHRDAIQDIRVEAATLNDLL